MWSTALTQRYKMPWHTSHCKTKTTSTVNSHERTNHHTTTTVLRPFFRDHPAEPVPEENFWTSWCKVRLTEADTQTFRQGATPPGLTSAHLWQTSQHKCSSSNLFADNVNTPKLTRPLRSVLRGWGTGLNWNTDSIGISTRQAQDGQRTGQEHTSLNRLRQSRDGF